MSILIFLAVLFVIVLVHEWGHYITARKTGMRVDEFAIGFPPRVWSRTKNGTTYSLNLLPIGGYVKILGENGVDEAELSPEDKNRTFASRPKWAQAVVLLAGVFMNVVLAWVLFAAVFMIGVPTQVPEETASPEAALTIVSTMPGSPAAVLPVGGEIISVTSIGDTLETLTPSALGEFVANRDPEGGVVVRYQYNDQETEVTLTPATGLLPDDPDREIVGVQTALVETVSYGPIAAVIQGFRHTYESLGAVTVGLFSFLKQAVVGEADYSQVAGPVGIVGLVGDAAAIGIVTLLMFTAFISLNLAVINLLPVPALDGGRLLFVLIEAVTGRDIPPAWAGYLNLAGFVLLIGLMIAVTYSDIAKLIS